MKEDHRPIGLPEKHLEFADRIRTLLSGATLQAVSYQGLEFLSDERTTGSLLAQDCETIYTEIDRLDHALILHTNRGSFHVIWDGTFYPYGLNVLEAKSHEQPAYSATIDASAKPMWVGLVGGNIDAVELEWDEFAFTNSETEKIQHYIVPMWMRFKVKGSWVFIGAADLLRDDQTATMAMDNLLVTTKQEMAERVFHFPPRRP